MAEGTERCGFGWMVETEDILKKIQGLYFQNRVHDFI